MSRLYTQLLGAGLSLLTLSAFAQEAASDANSVTAQWQPYDFNFTFMGLSTYYSCSGLENRLEQILLQLGAKPDMQVSASGCFNGDRVSKMVTARVRATMPVEVAATADTAQSTDATSIKAQRKTITLNTQISGYTGSGDCELMEQVRDRLLPAIKLKALENNLHCIPWQEMLFNQTVKVPALIAEKNAMNK
jgi:hypothetical protein